MNSIIWKGVPSTTIKGLLISELPPISKPKMRVKETTIDGRDGSIIEELGYEPYDKPVVIGLHGDFDINKVIKYFTGEGEVVFSNEPDKVYTAKIVGHIDYNRLLRYRQATIPFRVQPYKNKLNEAYKPAPTEAVSGTSIVVNVGADAKIKTFSIYGKTTQNGTPTPAAPVELVSVANGGSITVSAMDATTGNVQSLVVQTPNGLPGIPVFSGGNYTDASGQQWVCDEIDLVRGVVVQRLYQETYNGSEAWKQDINGMIYRDRTAMGCIPKTATQGLMCSHFKRAANPGVAMGNTYGITLYSDDITELNEWRAWLAQHPITVIYERETPIKTPISAEEIALILKSNEQTTILNDANANISVEYFKPYEVFNEGLETSKPIMVLKGEGTVVISVNGEEIFQYTFPEGETEVVIDSEKEDAYLGDVLKNRNMNGEFPVLLPGTNIIEWSGYVSSIEILPRSRWL